MKRLHNKKRSNKKTICFYTADWKALSFIIYPCASPYLLALIGIDCREVWYVFLIIPFFLSSYIFIIVCFTTELCLIFRKIKINYEKLTISTHKEFSFRRRKFQENVIIDLLSVYKMELTTEKIYPNGKDSPKNIICVAWFYMFDDTKKKIIIDYMSFKRKNEFIHRIHAINPNIYIIGLGYVYKVVQK